MKKLTFSAILATLTLFGGHAHANIGSITVTGRVLAPTCLAAIANGGQAVDLGKLDRRDFQNTSTSEPVSFAITLTRCSTDIYKRASFSFSGTTVSGFGSTFLALNDSRDSAEGVAVLLHDKNLNGILFDGQTKYTYPIVNGNNNIEFKASVVKISSNIKAGTLNARATFTVSYI